MREKVLRRDSYLCQPCKRKGIIHAASEVDHIKPKGKGGTDDPANLQAIAADCHKLKTLEDNGVKPRITIGLDGFPVEVHPVRG